MNVKELVEKLELEVIVAADLEKEIDGAYVGDLLSNVMARAKEGNLWITIQGHQNVVAVALLASVSAVIVVEDFEIEEEAAQRAEEKGINILRTSLNAYQLVRELVNLGIK
ncbi:MAG: DRTGG domain-containing protein [Halanaerobiales bacterium]